MKYEDVVQEICGNDWKTVNQAERDGGYAVACAIAFMCGTKPSLNEIARHLGVAPDDIVTAFNRLYNFGVFSDRFGLKKDRSFLSQNGEDEAKRAWAHIAGIGSFFVGV